MIFLRDQKLNNDLISLMLWSIIIIKLFNNNILPKVAKCLGH
jgi:hypothetical protein